MVLSFCSQALECEPAGGCGGERERERTLSVLFVLPVLTSGGIKWPLELCVGNNVFQVVLDEETLASEKSKTKGNCCLRF